MNPQQKNKLTDALAVAMGAALMGWLIWTFIDRITTDEPITVSSSCIDGIVVIADGHVIGCVNGEQGAGQMWTP